MGSSSSRPSGSGSGSGSGSRFSRTKHSISSLFLCGASSSNTTLLEVQFEDHPERSPIRSAENVYLQRDDFHNSTAESSPLFDSKVSYTRLETGTSSRRSNDITEDTSVNLPHQPSQGFVTQNPRVDMVAAADDQNIVKKGVAINCRDNEHSSSIEQEGLNSCSIVNHGNNRSNNSSDSRPLAVAPDYIVRHEFPRNENPQVMSPLSPGFPVSDNMQDLSEDVLHVDMVSVSSNILSSGSTEISKNEERRNDRRLFWDAFSRRSFTRHSDSPSIVFASGGSANDLGSRDRWHLDLSGDLHHDGVGHHHSNNLSARTNHANERRWLLRPEISERILRGVGEGDRQTTNCASGLHPIGTCSCEPFFTMEEFSTLASISRIIMLAEALFEVLEELYQQPFSLSLSMPAPESVVDSFPVKYHKKLEATKSESESIDVQQCYICLAEYEEGEGLRILPCLHEYHVACIDIWLKEINRVCPLCRRDICADSGQGSASSTEVSSR